MTVAGVTISERQEAETAMYLAAFGVLAPLGVIVAPRIAAAVAGGPTPRPCIAPSALLATSWRRRSGEARAAGTTYRGATGTGRDLGGLMIWALVAAALLARVTRPRPWRALLERAELAPRVWVLAAVLLVAAVAGLSYSDSWSVGTCCWPPWRSP